MTGAVGVHASTSFLNFALASGWPWEIRTFRVDPLGRHRIVYPTGHYANAVEATGAQGAVLAAGRAYDSDIDVLRLTRSCPAASRSAPTGPGFAVSGHWRAPARSSPSPPRGRPTRGTR